MIFQKYELSDYTTKYVKVNDTITLADDTYTLTPGESSV